MCTGHLKPIQRSHIEYDAQINKKATRVSGSSRGGPSGFNPTPCLVGVAVTFNNAASYILMHFCTLYSQRYSAGPVLCGFQLQRQSPLTHHQGFHVPPLDPGRSSVRDPTLPLWTLLL